MFNAKLLTALALAGSAFGITANFDDIGNRNQVGQYKGASWPGFLEYRAGQSGSQQVQPHSGQYYACSDLPESEGTGPSTATLNVNVTSSTGHLSSFYFACFNTDTFVASVDSCNFSVALNCINKNGNPVTLSYTNNYRPSGSSEAMTLVNLQPTYAAAAQAGVFNGDGSGARCTSYKFTSRPPPASGGGVQMKRAFFLDDAVFTLNQ